ncbi:MAG TPA: Ig-like domain-containing protein [Bacillota bacterium]|nr:Ig-like domain-containing protein [Bacillota bacterium]
MKKRFKQIISLTLILAMVFTVAGVNTAYAASAPKIVSITPADEATNVSIHASMIITFDQEMNTSGGYSLAIFGQSFTLGSQNWSNGNKTCTLPMQGLQYSTEYNNVTIGSFWNVSYTQCSDTRTISFTTEADTYPPIVTGTSPANSAANATVAGPIAVSFSEGMKTTVGTMTVAPTDAPASTVSGSTAWSNGNTTLTFSHPGAFEPNKGYTVTLTGFQDGPGNALPVYTFSFTTYTETTPPQLSSHTPDTDAANVALNTGIVLNFNEKMNTYAGGVTVTDADSHSVGLGAAAWSNGSKTATFIPTANLAYGTAYTVALSGFKDESNNDLGAVSFTFTTKEQEKTPTPSFSVYTHSFSTAEDTSAIFPVNSHPPASTTYKVYATNEEATPIAAGIAYTGRLLGEGGIEVTDMLLIFTSPATRPSVNTDYYISAIEPGKAESTRVKVTIKVPLAIASTSPAGGAADVPKSTDIVLNFGRGIQVIGWEAVSALNVAETATPSNTVTGTKVWSDSNQILTFHPDADLKPGTQYTVSYSNFQGTDGIAVLPDSFTFTTEKDTLTAGDLNYDLSPVTYNGGTQPLAVTGSADVGAVTVKYGGGTAAPKNAGTYAIAVDVAESAEYKAVAGLSLGNYKISKKDVTITGAAATDREFAAGDKSVALDFSGASVDGKIGSDAVVPSGGAGTMADDSIGTNKPVTVTGATLSGADADNYNLMAQPTGVTVNILATPVVDASISPSGGSYDLASPGDVSTVITWNSASAVAGVEYNGADLETPKDYYTVSGDTLIIRQSYLAAQGFTAGNDAGFTISFDKGASAIFTVKIVNNHIPGINADLKDLTVGGGTIGGFKASKTDYDVELPYGTLPGSAAAKVGAEAADPAASVKITQAASLPGSATVEVTAENGTTKKTYNVSFTLKASPAQSSEKDVTDVTAPAGGGVSGTDITATVANSVSRQVVSLSVSPNAGWKLYRDAGCTMEIADKTMTLSVGANTAYVRVTAQDGSTKRYAITITRQDSDDSGGSGRSGGSGGYTPALPGSVTEEMVKDAVKAAQAAAKESGRESDGITLEFEITGSGSYSGLNAVIESGAIAWMKEAGVKSVRIGSSALDLTFDAGAIAEINKQSTGPVTVSTKAPAKLSDAAKTLIGSRPVFDVTVSYQRDGRAEYITDFGKGAVTLGIAYKSSGGETAENLFGVYIDKKGRPQPLVNSRYENGRMVIGRNSLSAYGVGYKAPVTEFADTANHWAKESIDFVAGYSLIDGTAPTAFSPDTAITRADFLMALGRLSGADVSGYEASSFTDVKGTDPAMPYIEWAVKNKIVQGIGSGKFGPGQQISRQDMAVMMQSYAKAAGYKLPASASASAFSDNAKIGAYARDAVAAIRQAGIMQGKGGNTFEPQGNATRAEASVIVRRFAELVIGQSTVGN